MTLPHLVGVRKPASKSLKLHRAQYEVYKNKARFRILVAGRRFGKTTLSLSEIIRAVGGSKPMLVWYVAPTFQMAREIMWDQLVAAIPPKWLKKKPHDSRLEIRLRNGSIIQLKGADRPDTLRGRGLNFVVLDEFQDFRDNVWGDIIYPTLTTTLGRALIIGTPKAYNHFYELYRQGQSKKNQRTLQYHSWQFPTITSPFFPKAEIDNARRNLDQKTFRQEFLASFETMSGRVYYSFDRDTHVKKCPFNPRLPIWIGQDFNIDPMSSVIMQRQPNGDIWVVDEMCLPSSNVQEVCDELDRRYFKYKKQVRIYPDPAGSNRNQGRGETNLDVFRQAGYRSIFYKKKHPPVADRIQVVNSLLRSYDGTVRLYVDEKCKKLIDSFERTIYKPGRPEVDKSKGDEHMADAIGYPLHFIYNEKIILRGVSY